MPKYFATCGRGLEPVLAGELTGLGATEIVQGRGGVHFTGPPRVLYRANLNCRTAVRILQPVLECEVRTSDLLYDAVRSIDWSQLMTPEQTLAVDANVRDSGINHSQYAARRVKDAICDQFRDATGVRPSVDTERPMVGLNLHVSQDRAVLSLDSSWESLHKRGYRPVQTRAPINEALAAGLLLSAGYDGSVSVCDPLCGSGTFVIEACWMACRRPPGLTRKWFGFMGWRDFDRGIWAAVRDEARLKQFMKPRVAFAGSDVRLDAVRFAQDNARAAGVGNLIPFTVKDVLQSRPPAGPPGILICNPPYGERLGEEYEWQPLYANLGIAARVNWPGWRLLVFTASDRLAKLVGPVKSQTPFYNGSLACKLWEYTGEPFRPKPPLEEPAAQA